jgi:hypothetical protein
MFVTLLMLAGLIMVLPVVSDICKWDKENT